MDIDIYYSIVKEKRGKQCKIFVKAVPEIEGVYLGESNEGNQFSMVVRPTGDTSKQYEYIGVSDPNPDFENGDTLEIKNKIGVLVSAIDDIQFCD